jgi:hypothetical protein
VVPDFSVPPLEQYEFLKFIHKKEKQSENCTATGHSGGAD